LDHRRNGNTEVRPIAQIATTLKACVITTQLFPVGNLEANPHERETRNIADLAFCWTLGCPEARLGVTRQLARALPS